MKQKRLAALLMALAMLLTAACTGGDTGTPADQGKTPAADGEKPSDASPANVSPSGTEKPDENAPANGGDETGDPGETHTDDPEAGPVIRPLSMMKSYRTVRSWSSDYARETVIANDSGLYLTGDDALRYPDLQTYLEGIAYTSESSIDFDVEELIDMASDEDPGYPLRSGLENYLRRADEKVVSLLTRSSAVYGGYSGVWYFGTSIDAETGEDIAITDVIPDLTVLPALVRGELALHYWEVPMDGTLIEDYFTAYDPESINWSLDYNGVTFYFSPGEIAPEEYGSGSVTLSFLAHPEIFNPEYTAVPAAYAVELVPYCPFYTDLDGDGRLDEVTFVTAAIEDSDYGIEVMTGYGIYTDLEDCYYNSYASAYDYHPFYVRTADGRSLFYVFIESEPYLNKEMSLEILSFERGSIDWVSYMLHGLRYRSDDIFGRSDFDLLTDPECFYIDDFEDETRSYDFIAGLYLPPEPVAYCVGADGIPTRIDEKPVRVNSAEALIEAIAPDTTIIVEPGYYNLSEYMEKQRQLAGFDDWNEAHPYVDLRDEFDGVELVIQDVSNLKIIGGTDSCADTEIVVEPRYASVLNVENCLGVQLQHMTFGHTDAGSCSGNVISVRYSEDIWFNDLDLYGCGVIGIFAFYTSDLTATRCQILDCEYGPLEISHCDGRLLFNECVFIDNGGAAWYDGEGDVQFVFCTFGEAESEAWYPLVADFFNTWSGDYWDYDYDFEPEFDPESMSEITMERESMEDTYWIGYAMVDPESGDTEELPIWNEELEEYESVGLTLNIDGSARLDCRNVELDMGWEINEDGGITLKNAENTIYVTAHKNLEDEYSIVWLLLQWNDTLYWLY